MSSTLAEEIELLERVLLRLGCADTDAKLESCIGRFLTPVILKISSPHEAVRNKVVEVLTHIKRRITPRPQIALPLEALIDQYKANANCLLLQNFAIIFIALGYARLTLEQRSAICAKIINCEPNMESYQDKFFMLIVPDLGELKMPSDPAERKNVLNLDSNANLKQNFLLLLQDILLLPYGAIPDQEVPSGLSPYSFKKLMMNNWKAADLEKIKKGIVQFICSGVFTDKEIFILLVLASADTRFSVVNPALAELNKVCTVIDFSDPLLTGPLYTLFSGNNAAIVERKTSPCCARVRQKLLLYLIKCHGRGIHAAKGIQVIFEGLFGTNTNQKCKVLSLRFAENLIKWGHPEVINKVSKILLNGFNKLVGKDSEEPIDVQNAAYIALAQLARTCPDVINQDLKIVLSYFNHLTNSTSDLHSSIKDALFAMAPAFAWKSSTNDNLTGKNHMNLNSQQHILMAMLSDNADSKLNIVQNVTSVFLTTCYPEYYAPARYLLLVIAAERNSLYETITTHLYGVCKKDLINYNFIHSIENVCDKQFDDNVELDYKLQRRILPSFKLMMQYVSEMAEKGLNKSADTFVLSKASTIFSCNLCEEILYYVRLCLWYSAGANCAPGDKRFIYKIKEYIERNYEESSDNALYQYLTFIQQSIKAKKCEDNLECLYDLLTAAPDLLASKHIYLLQVLNKSLKDVSEQTRTYVAQIIGLLWAYGLNDAEFNENIRECLSGIQQQSLEHKHGCMLTLGHALSKRIQHLNEQGIHKEVTTWPELLDAITVMAKMLCESQWQLVLASVICFTMLGKCIQIPNVDVEMTVLNSEHDDDDNLDGLENTSKSNKSIIPTKLLVYRMIFHLLKSSSVRLKIREEAAKCLGNLAVGDGEYFTQRNLQKFLSLIKIQKDVSLNITIADAIATTLCGYNINDGSPADDFVNTYCDNTHFESFLNSLIKLATEINPHTRQACSVWLLAVVKHCNKHLVIINNTPILQAAFMELLSDDSEFVQDVASRGLNLVYSQCDATRQNDLVNSLLNQLIGDKRKVKKVDGNTELFAEGALGKTPTGGNMTTYKELCSLASDLNKPDIIYQFMQLANHNSAWTSKLGAAFGFKSLTSESKATLKPYLGKIIPRLYRYKYDPTPKIQNSMISIWDSIVGDSQEVIEEYYWDILDEIISNLTFNEWRVRIACCLALRDVLQRPNGLRLRSEEMNKKRNNTNNESNKNIIRTNDDQNVPEPELKAIWSQLFRVMDDIHEGTRLAAQGTIKTLSKLCVTAASSDHGKVGGAVASSILPLLLEIGVVHKVPDIRRISIKTISDMIDSSGALIIPHLPTLIPYLLKATGELDSKNLSYLSTRVSDDVQAQETIDALRADAAKSHHTTEATMKCIHYINYAALEKMTPDILDLIKTTVNMGTKIASAHFICLISISLGKEMTPLIGKYLAACLVPLRDRNATVQKYYANAIGHLAGLAKEQSLKNLFTKLNEYYMANTRPRAVALVIQSINRRHSELLNDYSSCIVPLMFFAMHEELNDENKALIELWRDLWNDIIPGNGALRLNIKEIIMKLEICLNDASWSRKIQAANSIKAIATRLNDSLENTDRLHLINILLKALSGRTFQGKERLLQALAALCKYLSTENAICETVVEAVMKECKKEEPKYRTAALSSLGDVLEQLEIDRFEDLHTMLWPLLHQKTIEYMDEDNDINTDENFSVDERNQRLNVLSKLKETILETLGKAWPKKSIQTQLKYQQQLPEQCYQLLKGQTRPIQLSILIAVSKFLERLQVWNNEISPTTELTNKEKKAKIDQPLERDIIIRIICEHILAITTYVASIPHTGLKKEALHIYLILLNRLHMPNDEKHFSKIQQSFNENLVHFDKDTAPEIRYRVKDIEGILNSLKLVKADM